MPSITRVVCPFLAAVLICNQSFSFAQTQGPSANQQGDAKNQARIELREGIFSDIHLGARIHTQSDISGVTLEGNLGYQLRNGLALVGDAYTTFMVGDASDLEHYRLGAGLRYTFDLAWLRPWAQATYGLVIYKVENLYASAHGPSATAGLDFRVAGIWSKHLWLGICGGMDFDISSDDLVMPVRAMATVAIRP